MNIDQVKQFVALADEKSALEQRLKQIEADQKALEEALLQQFQESGTQSVNVDGRTVSLRRDLFASPRDGDREAVIEALKAADLGQYVKEDYNANSLKAYVREMVRAAEAERGGPLADLTDALPEPLRPVLYVCVKFSVRATRS